MTEDEMIAEIARLKGELKSDRLHPFDRTDKQHRLRTLVRELTNRRHGYNGPYIGD